ncbi:MAG: non-ribosomal peptide synthase/polyketide synthase [Candidatus Omnitrophota bacterium]
MKLNKKNIQKILSLTPIQEGMLLHYLKAPGDDLYFEQLSLEIFGEINIHHFENAWNSVIQANEMLRTVFRWENLENPVQIILKEYNIQVIYEDLTILDPEGKKYELDQIKSKDRKKKFDIQEVPFRVTLCRIENDKYEMIMSNHHILYDGWSNGIILKEFFKAYRQANEGEPVSLPVKPGFEEFIKFIQQQDTAKHTEFWNRYLNDFGVIPEPSSVPKRRKKEITETVKYTFRCPAELTVKMDAFIKSANLTLASFLYGAWGILLQTYHSIDDLIFDMTVSGRNPNIKGIEDVVGLFINTLPLRIRTDPDDTVSEFLTRLRLNLQELSNLENSSTIRIRDELDKRDTKSLFDSVVVIENYPLDQLSARETAPLSIHSYSISEQSLHDLTVIITPTDEIKFEITFNTNLFDESDILRLSSHLLFLVEEMVNNPGKRVGELQPISKTERETIIRRLEASQKFEAGIEAAYVAPQNELEMKLVDIWSDVLHIDRNILGINHNFFDFGGHSLKAKVLTSRIHKELGVKIPLDVLFNHPTISGFAEYIGKAETEYDAPIEPAEEKEYYAVSAAQRRMVALHQMDPKSIAYNVSEAFRVDVSGEMAWSDRFNGALEKLIERHESLRTSFILVDGEPVQRIHQPEETMHLTSLIIVDHQPNPSPPDFVRPFDLSVMPLMRVGLIKIEENRYMLMFDAHHIICDGVSMNVFIHELTTFYKGENLPPLRIHYKDFSEWQNKRLQSQAIKTQENYWLRTFDHEIPVLNLPTDYPRTPERVSSSEGDKLYFRIPSEIRHQLKTLENKGGATLYMILLAACYTVLMKYSGQEDMVVGTLTDGRPNSDLQHLIGVMITTLALRNYPKGEMPFMDFLSQVKISSLKALENSDYPFEELLKHIRVKRETTQNPLFRVMFLLQNFEWPLFSLDGLAFTPYRLKTHSTTFEWRITAVETKDGIEVEIQYASRLFKETTIERFAGHLLNVLTEVSESPYRRLGDIPLLSEEEKHRILVEFNASDKHTGEEKTVIQWFEEQVQQTPDYLSIIDSSRQVTYRYVNEKSDLLARSLKDKGVTPGMIIGVMMERSVEMVISIYAILKAGGAYLPIDPSYPQERIDYMVKDSGAALLLTGNDADVETFRSSEGKKGLSSDPLNFSTSQPLNLFPIKAASLIYVIYTSGSTGKPKGAGLFHRGFFNLIYWFVNEFGLHEQDRNLLLTSLSFDLTQKNIFAPLVSGGAITFSDMAYFDPAGILQAVNEKRITWMNCTPGMMSKIIEYSREEDFMKLVSLRYVFLGGEPIVMKSLRAWVESSSFKARIINTYGPTECTDISAFYSVEEPEKFYEEVVPTGKPIDNARIYLFDKWFEPVPIGVPGELCIGGEGVGLGYLNRPELSAEKFSTFLKKGGAKNFWFGRLYKTGDLAKWLDDGNIEFLGRIDHQVKIRGYRIELGEIENRLLAYNKIKECVVLPLRRESDAMGYLCAYFTANEPIEIAELKKYLLGQLPDYMVPAYFIPLEKFCLTPNGKVDRTVLPVPDETGSGIALRDETPANETEIKLLTIWREVLRNESIRITDNFFETGGDSLLVIQAIARIREELGVDLPVRTFFEHATIGELAKEIESMKTDTVCISKAPTGVPIPLSFSQEQLWFLQQLNDRNASYFVPRAIRIQGRLDISLIERTFDEIIRRHEILRTVFPIIDGRPIQRVLDHSPFQLPVMDWCGMEEPDRNKAVEQWMAEEMQRPFDFEKGPMIRITLIQLAENQHKLVLTEHHLVHDGWTQGVLLKEFISIFNAFVKGEESPLPELMIQYKDFAWWQRNYLQGEILERQLEYWKGKLSGLAPLLELPTDNRRPSEISGNGEVKRLFLSKELSDHLVAFGKHVGATLFMTMLGVFKVLLYRYTGTGDLCVGTGVANRRYKEMEGMLGMVINTLALRTEIDGALTFRECLQRVKSTCLEAYENEDTPFEKIVEVLKPGRSLSYTPIFQVIYSFMDTPAETLTLPGLELHVEDVHNWSAKFDINIIVEPPSEERMEETGGRIEIIWEYNVDIFRSETTDRMIGHYIRLLEEAISCPDRSIARLSMLGDEEIDTLLHRWNDTGSVFPKDKTIHELFEEQIGRTPDHLALIGSTSVGALREAPLQLSYRELNERSEQLAYNLIYQGVKPNTIVGLRVRRSIEMIIGILGILKAGAAYLPLNPDQPEVRTQYMLKDSGAALLLTSNNAEVEKLRSSEDKMSIEELLSTPYPLNLSTSQPLNFFPSASPVSSVRNHSDFAYVIYTSGSTGKPKGVPIRHANISPLLHWGYRHIGLNAQDKVVQNLSYYFDWSVWEIFIALTSGSSLYMVSGEMMLDSGRYVDYMNRCGITVLHITPTHFQSLVSHERTFLTLRHLCIGAEKLTVDLVKRSDRCVDETCRIYNMYGPTEATIMAAVLEIDRSKISHYKELSSVPIGQTLGNNRLLVLDRNLNPCPVNVSGELIIEGDGVASGYFNNPELTLEKFLPGTGNNRLYNVYKTGDSVRWLPDGNIEFLGRIDQQVKIRGFRIEPGEIEACLLELPDVKDVLVIPWEHGPGESSLCAYVVPCGPFSPDAAREYVLKALPDYMVPSYFIALEKIPLNPNGKVDTNALPEPERTGERYTAPRDQREKMLVDIWADVLGIEKSRIGIHDNFFELGGHSLKATDLILKIHKLFHVRLAVSEIFVKPTIEKLSASIRETAKERFIALEPVEEKEYYPLSSAQKRLYILNQMDRDGVGYNIPSFFVLKGEINKDKFERTFNRLIQRHESFRTSFHMVNDEPVQRVHDNVAFEINYVATEDTELTEKNKNIIKKEPKPKVFGSTFFQKGGPPEAIIQPFDLTKAPLMRVGLTKIEENKHLLIVDMHHIISDGASMRIVAGDFMALYQGKELPEIGVQYKDFSAWQSSDRQKSAIKRQEDFWLDAFEGEIPVLNLPIDYERPLVQSFEGSRIRFGVATETTDGLKQLISETGATLYMVLLSIYTILLSKLSGQEDLVVGSPISGRGHADLETIIGMFVNTLALRNYPIGEKTYLAFLHEIKERTLNAFENSDYPYEDLVERVVSIRDAGRNPLFDTMFVLQNTGITAIEIPGLSLSPYEYENKISKFDLTLSGIESSDTLLFNFEYSTKLFKRETIDRFIIYFKNIINGVIGVIKNKERRISDLEIITEEEKSRILCDFNQTDKEYPKDKTIQKLFEDQVERTPDNIALTGKTSEGADACVCPQLSYEELNHRSNELAYALIQKGVEPDTIVGIKIERSVEMIIGILGILKAGGAYLPIGMDYPQERIDYMLKDSAAKFEFLTERTENTVKGFIEGEKVPSLEHLILLTSYPLNFASSVRSVSSVRNHSSLAYVIYTSGTTGNPKGVLVEHRNAVNVLSWFIDTHHIGPGTRILQVSDFTFDASVNQIFGSLVSGASLYIVSREIRSDIDKMRQYLLMHAIHIINFVPSYLKELLCRVDKLESLHTVLSGAEKLDDATKDTLIGKGYRLVNQYGPTETTIDALAQECSSGNVNLGKPISNATVYILDKYGNVLPIGIMGELVIGGAGVSRGYLNQPELTSEKFFSVSSLPSVRKRLYKTGDLCRWLNDGQIEFLGRIDDQVKIRGFRIELGEIEDRLLTHPDIRNAAVLLKDDHVEDPYLAAYVVSDVPISDSDLKEYLSKTLPDYMIPAYFMQLDALPMTSSGKMNRKALPDPPIRVHDRYIAPVGRVEETLAQLWADILKINKEQISVEDNFFQLGGHSLKATVMASQIHKELNVRVPLPEVFKRSTIRGLAQYIRAAVEEKYKSIDAVEEKEYYDLSYAQRRLWVLCQFEEDSTAYNMPGAVVLSGKFNASAFERAVRRVAERHESLRTLFILVNGEPRQKVIDSVNFNRDYHFFDTIDIRESDEPERERITRNIYRDVSNKAFNLEKGPLFRFVSVQVEDDQFILILNVHHIISDGWSRGIINNDLISLYNAFVTGSENHRPPLALHYKDYSRWHNRLIEVGHFDAIGKYWLDKFKDKPNGIELPLDHPRQPIQTFNGGRVAFTFTKGKISQFQQLCGKADATFFMGLLTLLDIFLYKHTGQEDILIGAPIANRKQAELHPLVGFLVNTLIYRNQIKPSFCFKDILAEVKVEALQCYEYQDFPFDLLVERLELERDLSQSPLFNVMIAHNNAETENPTSIIEGVNVEGYTHIEDFNMSKFDLTFFMNEVEDGLWVRIEYNSDLFERETIERMAVNFRILFDEIMESEGVLQPVSSLNILSRDQYETVTRTFNDTRYPFPQLTLMELFEKRVEAVTDKTAIVDHDSKITYGDLNKKANRIAHFLRNNYQIQPNEIIGISMDRSIDMIAVIVGVLKSGAAYLAVDPTYPRDRVLHVLSDSRSKLLITDAIRPELFDTYTGEIINILDQWEKIESEASENPLNVNRLSDILYVNYTSGSTGTPNGAMLSHDCLTNLIFWQNEKTEIDCSLRCLQFTSINFCVSFQEIMGTLTSGGELHLIGDIERQDIDFLMNFLVEHQIEILFLPFSYLNFLFNESGRWDRSFQHHLKHIITAGEQLKITAGLKRFLDMNPELKLHNHYGSTEMHVVTSYTLDASSAEKTPIPPAGKPVSNVKIFILDESLNPVPVGVYGELCVEGSREILGYINNKELTDKKLVSCPKLSQTRLYRSGDMGRWLPDGNIELRGRKDFLVKVRGFRVEPGEIESKILAIDRVRECVVVVQEDGSGQKFLVAYVSVLTGDERIDGFEIKRLIGTKLPHYMIPQIIMLDSLPLMPNGKVDREKLPKPELSGERIVLLPSNPVEEKLVSIWSDLLGDDESKISIDDNFFELGGHSLKATVMVSRIHQALDVKVELVEIFRSPTIREIAHLIRDLNKETFEALEPVEEKEYYVLSSAQKRLYILHQMSVENTGYNMPAMMVLEGVVDRKKLEHTCYRLVERHESLRTSFHMVEGEPVQRVHDRGDLAISSFFMFLTEFTENTVGRDKGKILDHFIRPFDLTRAPLIRVGLIQNAENNYLLTIDMHHIISDGTSIGLLVKDFMALYRGENLPPLRIQYKDFAEWQQGEKNEATFQSQEAFWLRQFEGEIPVLALPVDNPRPSVQSFEGRSIGFGIDPKVTGALKKWALETGSTMYILLLALYTAFLSKVSGQEDIVVGSPVAGRGHVDLETIIGMFVNTLALRNYPLGEKRFIDFLQEVKDRVLAAFDNQDYQYEVLIEHLEVNRDTGRNPLFDTMFVLQNMDIEAIDIPGLTLSPLKHETQTSKFDLTLSGIEIDDALSFKFEYCTKLFKPETIERFIVYFKNIVNRVIENENKNRRISDIDIISEEERDLILNDFNRTETEYPNDKTIHDLFDEKVKKTPDHLALIGQTSVGVLQAAPLQMTYNELNEQSNQLAYALIQKGVGPDTVVGIKIGRSIEMIIGILGILKAGGAYLPIGIDYPQERVDYMLKDSGAALLLTSNKAEVEKLRSSEGKEGLFLDPLNLSTSQPLNLFPLPASGYRLPATFLAYIIYTSGSTGTPKGVMVEHSSVVNLLHAMQNKYPFHPKDVYLLKTAYIFDVSVTELFGWYMGGGKLAILEAGSEKDPEMLANAIEKHGISHINFVPSMFHAVVDYMSEGNAKHFSSLKYIFLAGEALTSVLVKAFKGLSTPIILENIYGPTESTVYASWYSLSQWQGATSVPIGKPLPNVRLYILNRDNQMQPVGVPGELWISGRGLARGYLNRPELTAERFASCRLPVAGILNRTHNLNKNQNKSFCPAFYKKRAAGGIFYKTGDLCRWLDDGNIEFLGRIDRQVKIRGFRVELGEIENRFMQYPKIKRAVVLLRDALIAYFVSEGHLDVSMVRDYLSSYLPDYMIPAYFIEIDEIPLTPNGKIDIRALPNPEIVPGADFTAPRDPTERKLAAIWANILGIATDRINLISIDSNFFELGGHSLKATALSSQIHKEFNVKITLANLFKHQTIRKQSEYIKEAVEDRFTDIEPIEEKEYYDLSYIQKRIWLICQMNPETSSYNIPGHMETDQPIDTETIETILQGLSGRHESLRTFFKQVGDQPVQFITKTLDLRVETIDLSSLAEEEKQRQRGIRTAEIFLKPFDLSRAPLFRCTLIKMAPDHYTFIFVMHHIIGDAASLDALKKDFNRLTEDFQTTMTAWASNPLTIGYKDFAEWYNKRLESGTFKDEAHEYWLETITSGMSALELPTDFSGRKNDRQGAVFCCFVPEEIKSDFEKIAQNHNASLFTVFFSAFNIFLFHLTKQTGITCAIVGSGRDHIALQPIVGCFSNTIPVKIDLTNENNFSSFLHKINREVFRALRYQNYPIEIVLNELRMEYPEITVAINMPGLEEGSKSKILTSLTSYHVPGFQDIKFQLELYILEFQNGIRLDWSYKSSVFLPETIEFFAHSFLKMLENIAVSTEKSSNAE